MITFPAFDKLKKCYACSYIPTFNYTCYTLHFKTLHFSNLNSDNEVVVVIVEDLIVLHHLL